MSVTSPRAASGTFFTGETLHADFTWILEAAYIEIQDCYYGNKHDILSVSKSVAWYQKYVRIKVCLPKGSIHRARRQFEMMFIPAPGKVNYTQAKAYCPIILLSFTQKTKQKLVTRNTKDEIMGHVSYIYKNLPTNQASPQEPQCPMRLHIYRKQEVTVRILLILRALLIVLHVT